MIFMNHPLPSPSIEVYVSVSKGSRDVALEEARGGREEGKSSPMVKGRKSNGNLMKESIGEGRGMENN